MIYEHIEIQNATILICKVNETQDELKLQLENFEAYKHEYEVLKTDKRRIEFLAVRVAFNKLFNKPTFITYNKEGKPFAKNNNAEISITHSGKYVAIMQHPTHKNGIDIELPTDKFKKLYSRFLSEWEQNQLYDEHDIRKVQIAWSAKEALFKIIGNDAVNFSSQLEIANFDLANSGNLKAKHIPSNKVFELFYKISEHYVLVYCIE